jgi:uncharacterized membrane protein
LTKSLNAKLPRRHASLPACAAIMLATSWPVAAQGDDIDFAAVRMIVAKRCRFCHTAIPQEDGLNATSQPPKGIKFDSPADYQNFAPLILEYAVKSKTMPPDNATHMTDDERTKLGKWIAAGAHVP